MNIAGEILKTFSRTPKMRQIAVACSDSGVSDAALGRVQETGTQGVARRFHSSPYVTSGSRRVGEQQVRNNVAYNADSLNEMISSSRTARDEILLLRNSADALPLSPRRKRGHRHVSADISSYLGEIGGIKGLAEI